LKAIAAAGVGDAATGLGGALDFRRVLIAAFSLHAGATARFAIAPTSGIDTRIYAGRLGFGWRPPSFANGRGSLGGRLDALVAVAQFTHASASSGAAHKVKTLPGADAFLEAGYSFTPALELALSAGAEYLFGNTEVFVDGSRRTSLAPLHPVVELGLGIGF
jgi:hypothetical protein